MLDDATPVVPSILRFQELSLASELMRGIQATGFEQCTPIQMNSLPPALAGQDVAGQAQTGTGKTASFLITIIQQQLAQRSSGEKSLAGAPKALILAPTRELATQIESDALELMRFTPLKICALFGGMDFDGQARQLAAPVDVVVGTPGRTLDFYRRKVLKLHQVKILVIDETDRMFSMGFMPDVGQLIRATPPKKSRQTLLFSATFSHEVLRLAEQCTVDAVRIIIEPERPAAASVKQLVYMVTGQEKLTLLYNLIKSQDLARVLIFTNRRDTTRDLQAHLQALGINCEMLSGEVKQQTRMTTLERFKQGKITALVATDVAGRGLHIKDISHVINYNLPEYPDDYIHRIGRTGRAGADGLSISFACEDDGFQIPAIEEAIKNKLNCQYPGQSLLTPLPKYQRPAPPGRNTRTHRNTRRR